MGIARGNLVRAVSWARQSRMIDDAVRYHPWHYRRVRRLRRRYAKEDPSGQARIRNELLRRALAWASETPHGRETAGGGRLADWPLLEKTALRDRPAAFRLRRLIALPASTGGTTGLPLQLWRSPRCIAAERALLDHHLEAATGLTFRDARIAVLRGDNVKDPSDHRPPFGAVVQQGRRLLLSSQHLGGDTVAWYADTLRAFAPDILWIYPSTGEALVRLLRRAGLTLRLPLVLSASEMLSETARTWLAKTLHARVIDYYGLAERVALAFSTHPGCYRFDPVYGTVELLPLAEPGPDEMAVAEIVATGHWNDAMPLVRYRTGDRILCHPGTDATALMEVATGARPFRALLGRAGDYLLSPRGEVLVGIDHLPREINNILRLQVIQETLNQVEIRVVPAPGYGPSDREQLEHNLRGKLPDDMSVQIVEDRPLRRSATGKTPFVIRAPQVPQ